VWNNFKYFVKDIWKKKKRKKQKKKKKREKNEENRKQKKGKKKGKNVFVGCSNHDFSCKIINPVFVWGKKERKYEIKNREEQNKIKQNNSPRCINSSITTTTATKGKDKFMFIFSVFVLFFLIFFCWMKEVCARLIEILVVWSLLRNKWKLKRKNGKHTSKEGRPKQNKMNKIRQRLAELLDHFCLFFCPWCLSAKACLITLEFGAVRWRN